MFEAWNDEFSAPLRRVLDPPTPVLVDLNVVLAPEPGFRRDAISMRTKNAGLDTTTTVPGLLHAWARTTTGAWIGFVHLGIPTGDRRGYVETRQWCPAQALTRREP
jgi:dienelactone hydrolase